MLTVKGNVDEDQNKNQKVAIVAEQLYFVSTLAGNDPVKRSRAMKKLRRYLQVRVTDGFRFSYDDFLRIWKGLFYCMWMSDKPLVQEELCEEISQLVHALSLETSQALMFIKAFYSTLINEWYGIDYHRMDKFLMFVRRFLRQSLFYCKRKKWNESVVEGLSCVLRETILCVEECKKSNFDLGLIIHFCDIFVEELAKVGAEVLPPETLLILLEPFVINLKDQSDERIQNTIKTKVFYDLIQQSPLGLEYEEKFEAWKRAGFPGSSWKEMKFVGKEDNRSGVRLKHLDPRAGKVNVYLPRIQFNAKDIAKLLRKHELNSHWKKNLEKIAHKFDMLAEGEYPLTQHIPKAALRKNKFRFSKKLFDEATENLLQFERELEIECKNLEGNSKRKHGKGSKSKTPKKLKLDNKKFKEKENCKQTENKVCNNHSGEISPNEDSKRNKIVRKKLKKKTKNLMEWNVEEINKSSLEVKSSIVPAPDGDDESDLSGDSGICTTEKWAEKIHHSSPAVLVGEVEKEESTLSGFSVENILPNVPELKEDLEDNLDLSTELLHCKPVKNDDSNTAGTPVNRSSESSLPENYVSSCLEEIETAAASIEDQQITAPKSTTLSYPETPNRIIKKGRRRRSRRSTDQLTLGELDPAEPQTCVIESEMNGSDSEVFSEKLSYVPYMSGNDEEETVSPSINMPTINTKRNSLRGKGNKNSRLVSETIGFLETDDEISDVRNLTNSSPPTPLSSVLTPRKRRRLRSVTPSSGKKVNIVLKMNRSQAVSEYVAAVKQSPSVPHDANKKPCKGVLKRSSIQSPINPFYRPPKGINKI